MADRDRSARWLADAIATGEFERVRPNMGAAGERVNDARRHVHSARVLADDDMTLAVSACHDAIRKAITAHLVASGLRPRGGDGAHRIVLRYAREMLAAVIDGSDLDEADDIRKDRALAEYGDFASRKLTSSQVRGAADVAERIVNAIAGALASARPNDS